MALTNEQINKEAERMRKEEERRAKQAPRGQTVAVPRGEVGSFSKAYQGYKFVEEGTPESRRAMNLGEFTEKEAQRRFEEKRGKDWVGQMEARVREGEPQRAREALATVAQRNKALWEKPLPSPLQEDRTLQEINLPGGGRVKFGNKTLARMRKFEAEEKKRVAERQAKAAAAKEKIYADRYAAATQRYGREMDPKKRYAAELAERGLRNPLEATTPQERRQIEEENTRERMADFRTAISAKNLAAMKEREFQDLWAGMPKSFKDQQVGGDSSNVTTRRRYFERLANDEIRRELSDRAELRRKINTKRTTANPEGGLFEIVEPRGDAMSQPFGLVPPATTGGVSFGAISEANALTVPAPTTEEPEVGTQSIVEELESVGEQPQPPSKPSKPKASPRTESAIKARSEKERKDALMKEKREIERALYNFDKRGNRGKIKPKFDLNSDVVKKALDRLKQIENEL